MLGNKIGLTLDKTTLSTTLNFLYDNLTERVQYFNEIYRVEYIDYIPILFTLINKIGIYFTGEFPLKFFN